jgi:hypothetical protein
MPKTKKIKKLTPMQEAQKLYLRLRYEKNKEEMQEYHRAYYHAHKEEINARRAAARKGKLKNAKNK